MERAWRGAWGGIGSAWGAWGGMTQVWDGMGGHVGGHWESIQDAGHERGRVGAWESMKGAWVGMREA